MKHTKKPRERLLKQINQVKKEYCYKWIDGERAKRIVVGDEGMAKKIINPRDVYFEYAKSHIVIWYKFKRLIGSKKFKKLLWKIVFFILTLVIAYLFLKLTS